MPEARTIAVVGATGAQGGGLVRAILANPDAGFRARAITRNPDSDRGKELAAAGAEVVRADLDDQASLERAFEGAHGAFLVTNFWEHFSAEKEVAQARAMAEAARTAGVSHLVWSTLEDTRLLVPLSDNRMPTLHGKYKVPHFDGKGEADAIFGEVGVPTTLFRTSLYWDNFIHFGMGPKRGDDGVLSFALPMGDRKLAGIAAADIGPCAFGVFKGGAEFIGRTVGIAGDILTCEEMARVLTRGMGEEVRYHAIEPEVYRSFGFPGADDLGNMFQYYRDFSDEFCAARDLALSRRLNPQLLDFEGWTAKYGHLIPKE